MAVGEKYWVSQKKHGLVKGNIEQNLWSPLGFLSLFVFWRCGHSAVLSDSGFGGSWSVGQLALGFCSFSLWIPKQVSVRTVGMTEHTVQKSFV